jgi:peptidyl-prolyl cis-trans isomerase SurA
LKLLVESCKRLRRILAPTLLLLLAVKAAVAQVRIAAIVNDEVITVQELVERLEFVIATSNLPQDERTRARLAPQVLRSYIDETLQLQEARRLGIRVSESEIDRALDGLAQRNAMSTEQFRAWFAERRLSLATLRRQIGAQLAWARVVRQVLQPRVVVSREQLELALNNLAGSAGEELRLAEILLPVYAPEQEAQVLEQARELVSALRDGADFAALAQQVSVAASAETGGDLGWVPVSSLAEELRRVVAALPVGQPSEPIITPDGVRILMVRDRRQGSSADIDVVEIAQVVIPLSSPRDQDAINAARRQAQAIRPRLTSCAAADAVAAELRAPASGRLGWMRLEELPLGFRETVARLGVGEVSEPLPGPLGLHLLLVCDRGGEKGRRALARLALEREQLERLANRYLRDLRKSAFIDVRL